MENNLIDRQAAINALDGNVIVTSRKSAQAVMDYIRGCADKIRSLPSAQPEQQWIPCSEPPKESGTYIVTAYDGTDKRVTFVKYRQTLKRWDLTGARAYWRILAYKPLPEPYKEKDNEKRSFDEMIAYFNRRVADMNISQDCKMELVGMITAIGYEHETSVPHWIPCSEHLPEANGRYLVTRGLNACGALWNRVYLINYSDLMGLKSERIWWDGNVGKSDFERIDDVIAWKPLEEPWKGEQE